MVQIAADAAQLRNDTSGLLSKAWAGVLPRHVLDQGEVAVFAGIGRYYEAMGVIGRVDTEPDNRDAVVGEIAVRLGVKPGEMSHFRHRYTNDAPTPELINLRALTRLGAVHNEAELLSWFLTRDGVGGGVG